MLSPKLAAATMPCFSHRVAGKSPARNWPEVLSPLRYCGEETVAEAAAKVLTVRTSEGDLVLDKMTSAIRNWSHTPYRYFARQSQSNGSTWERIGSPSQS